MNINVLEKMTRQALKGKSMKANGADMLDSGVISPAEHRSLQSLSFQIAANMQANKTTGTTAFVQPNLMWV